MQRLQETFLETTYHPPLEPLGWELVWSCYLHEQHARRIRLKSVDANTNIALSVTMRVFMELAQNLQRALNMVNERVSRRRRGSRKNQKSAHRVLNLVVSTLREIRPKDFANRKNPEVVWSLSDGFSTWFDYITYHLVERSRFYGDQVAEHIAKGASKAQA